MPIDRRDHIKSLWKKEIEQIKNSNANQVKELEEKLCSEQLAKKKMNEKLIEKIEKVQSWKEIVDMM